MSRVVLVAPDSRLEQQVRYIVSEEMVVIPATDPQQFSDRLGRLAERPELIVFGDQLHRSLALSLASAGRQHTDSMAIVNDEPDIMVEAMRAGISDVIPSNADRHAIELLVARAHEFSREAAGADRPAISSRGLSPAHTIAVVSPKGGVGKTTVAANLAMGLSLLYPGCVVLVDLDLQFGDVASTLGLEPTYFLESAVSKGAARDSLVLRTALTRHPLGLSVVCGPESPATADRITPAQVAHLLRQLADEFLYVVVDTSPGLLEHTLTVLEESTDVVAVTTMDVSSVRGMRKELDVLDQLELLPGSRHIVVNQADRASGLTVRDIETAIGTRVDVVVPRTKGAATSTNRGNPVIIDHPRDKASRNLRALITRLSTEPNSKEKVS